jgi:hypothetical protein
MTPDAYYYISIAYVSIAGLSVLTLSLKGFNTYKEIRYLENSEKLCRVKPLQYVLHALHIPPYLIAAYWYYDAYKENTHLN